MKTIIKKYNNFIFIIISGIISLFIITWFRGWNYINSIDSWFKIDPIRFFSDSLYFWKSNLGLGYSSPDFHTLLLSLWQIVFLKFFKLFLDHWKALVLSQFTIYYLTVFLGIISAYLFFKEFYIIFFNNNEEINNKRKVIIYIISLLYIFNQYTLIYVFFRYTAWTLLWVAISLTSYILLKYLKTGFKRYLVYFIAINLTPLNGVFSVGVFPILLIIWAFLLTLFILYNSSNFRFYFIRALIFFIIVLLIGFWIIIPQIVGMGQMKALAQLSPFSDKKFLDYASKFTNIPNILKFMGYYGLNAAQRLYGNFPYLWINNFNNINFQILSYIYPLILALSALALFTEKSKRLKKLYLLIFFVILGLVLIMKGVNAPFSNLGYLLLSLNSVFFRHPYDRFIHFFAFLYFLVLLYFFYKISILFKCSKYTLFVIAIAAGIHLFLAYPLFTGDVIHPLDRLNLSNTSYWSLKDEFKELSLSDFDKYRTLVMPFSIDSQEYSYNINGQINHPNAKSLIYSILSEIELLQYPTSYQDNDFLHTLYYTMQNKNYSEFINILSKLNFRYIIFQKDATTILLIDPRNIEIVNLTPDFIKKLEGENLIVRLFENKNIKFYKLNLEKIKTDEHYGLMIYPLNNVFSFNNSEGLNEKYNFIKDNLGKEFNFVSAKDKDYRDLHSLVKLNNLFEDLNPSEIGKGIKQRINLDANNSNVLYKNKAKAELYYNYLAGRLEIYTQNFTNLFLNGQRINFPSDGQKNILFSDYLNPQKQFYLNLNGRLFLIEEGIDQRIDLIDNHSKLKLVILGDNLIPNPSFEEGLWREKVDDCNAYDKNPILGMELNTIEKTEGNQSLQLEATRHIACTSVSIPVKENTNYLFSFDYQGENAQQAGYHLQFNDKEKTTLTERLEIKDESWQTFSKKIKIPSDATKATLHIYAYETDGRTKNIVRYDNFKFSELKTMQNIDLSVLKPEFEKINLSVQTGENNFEYIDDNYQFNNLIPNPSFEEGLWREKVDDCHAYDKNPLLGMELNTTEKTEGNQSLQLEATRHIACTSVSIPVKENTYYLFSFDYQGENAQQAGYHLQFNDKEKTTLTERLEIKDESWQTFSKKIKIPSDATKATLHIYAYETDGRTKNIVRYDNFKFIEIPDFENWYYLISDPCLNLKNPEKVDFEIINPTKKIVHIKKVSTPFFLTMSESYHPQWQLEINNQKIKGPFRNWFPLVRPDKISDDNHLKLDNFLNVWYVDINELRDRGLIKDNGDGTYDIDLVIEFWPQRWFYLGLIVSGATLIFCLGYLIFDYLKNRKKEKFSVNNYSL